jgi:hypothetical protein
MTVQNPVLPLFQDEGTTVGRAITINIVGAGASVAVVGTTATITIPGGGGGGGGSLDDIISAEVLL